MLKVTLFVFLAIAADTSPRWFEGGTLHDSTLAEWMAASKNNRLSTAADFVAIFFGEEKIRDMGGRDATKEDAIWLVECIDSSARRNNAEHELAFTDTRGAAYLCAYVRGWRELEFD